MIPASAKRLGEQSTLDFIRKMTLQCDLLGEVMHAGPQTRAQTRLVRWQVVGMRDCAYFGKAKDTHPRLTTQANSISIISIQKYYNMGL